MKCCNGSNNNHENKHNDDNKKHMSHMWMMALCCGAPIILLFLLPFLGRIIPGTGNYLSRIIPFLCPVMMLMMLPMMFKRDGRNKDDNHCEPKRLKD